MKTLVVAKTFFSEGCSNARSSTGDFETNKQSTERDPEKGGGREAGGFEQRHLQNQSQTGGTKVQQLAWEKDFRKVAGLKSDDSFKKG